jgi:hypothetical protein
LTEDEGETKVKRNADATTHFKIISETIILTALPRDATLIVILVILLDFAGFRDLIQMYDYSCQS